MKIKPILFIVIFFTFLFSINLTAQVKVKGYYKKDGTYVQPHYRSSPDGNPYNNYSYPGNTNPYTGKTATGNEDTYLNNYYNNNSNYNYEYNYSNDSYINEYYTSGNLIIYTDYSQSGELSVYVDGEYVGTLSKYFTYGSPSFYGEEGTVSITTSPGYHIVQALNSNGFGWQFETDVSGNTNNIVRLTK